MSPWRSEAIVIGVLRGLTLVSGVVALLISFFLLQEALPFLQQIGFTRFFQDASWVST